MLSVVDITVLLALSVYQLVVSDSLPVSSESVPVLGLFLFCSNVYYHKVHNKEYRKTSNILR